MATQQQQQFWNSIKRLKQKESKLAIILLDGSRDQNVTGAVDIHVYWKQKVKL